MKIKILKDIPGYKAGSIIDDFEQIVIGVSGAKDYRIEVGVYELIGQGFAEEIKDGIDIKAIREIYGSFTTRGKDIEFHNAHLIYHSDVHWFSSYLVVKAVIDQLNANEKRDDEYYTVVCDVTTMKVDYWNNFYKVSILPSCNSREICEKVISLCEPELKVLFGVK